jgi:hypothetical protein
MPLSLSVDWLILCPNLSPKQLACQPQSISEPIKLLNKSFAGTVKYLIWDKKLATDIINVSATFYFVILCLPWILRTRELIYSSDFVPFQCHSWLSPGRTGPPCSQSRGRTDHTLQSTRQRYHVHLRNCLDKLPHHKSDSETCLKVRI